MNQGSVPKPVVWWVAWATFLMGACVMYFVLGSRTGDFEVGSSGNVWLFGALPVVVASGLRWALLPRIQTPAAALPLFLLGIALCEASLFLGLFIFSAQKQTLFTLTVVGMIQFAPYFAHHYQE
jgi:hypothetical protein